MKTMTLLQAEDMAVTLDCLALEVLERHGSCERLVLVGIQRRGVDLATRLQALLQERLGCALPLGSLDINLYRDDWTRLAAAPVIGVSSIDFSLDDKDVLLVDDVLFSGRTIRAALEALLDYGRPCNVELLVFIDRGHRELPIEAKYVGKRVETQVEDTVNVMFAERDGRDAVCVERAG